MRCQKADVESGGRYWCSREPMHDGPCAAHVSYGYWFFWGAYLGAAVGLAALGFWWLALGLLFGAWLAY